MCSLGEGTVSSMCDGWIADVLRATGGSLRLPRLGTSTRRCRVSTGRLRTLDTSPATSNPRSDTPNAERSIECLFPFCIRVTLYDARRLCTIKYSGHVIYLSCTIYGPVFAISFAVGVDRSQFQSLQSKIRTPRTPHKSRQYPLLP